MGKKTAEQKKTRKQKVKSKWVQMEIENVHVEVLEVKGNAVTFVCRPLDYPGLVAIDCKVEPIEE